MSAGITGRRTGGPARTTGLLGLWDLPCVAASARTARGHVRARLREETFHGDLDTVSLLVSELVTNSVRYSESGLAARPGTVSVVLARDARFAEIDVIDAGSRWSTPTVLHLPLGAERGRGLRLVREFSASWGVVIDASGCCVWFRVPWDG
ncbi:ATP-binding protein [Microtetraspora sp. NBRC 13810]|uniref:ATP-binding protein n=1 Tax=Microtetraspora sp. NBRC 13810 TaxID=3030990 RepID=UPI002555C649|nr:ATP-binding protein [Microtetraspora sp. NBRC 13810]